MQEVAGIHPINTETGWRRTAVIQQESDDPSAATEEFVTYYENESSGARFVKYWFPIESGDFYVLKTRQLTTVGDDTTDEEQVISVLTYSTVEDAFEWARINALADVSAFLLVRVGVLYPSHLLYPAEDLFPVDA